MLVTELAKWVKLCITLVSKHIYGKANNLWHQCTFCIQAKLEKEETDSLRARFVEGLPEYSTKAVFMWGSVDVLGESEPYGRGR